jgi:hypothetical protein
MDSRPLRLLLACALVGLALIGVPGSAWAAAGCDGVWRTFKGPSAGDENEKLVDVTAISANDIWAVGDEEKQLFLDHWDGTSWTPVLNTVGKDSHPTAIAARTSSDIWAVGFQGGTAQAMSIHYNGTEWSQVVIQKQGAQSELDAVAPVTANDAWGVGESLVGGTYKPLALRWNGTKWSPVAMPSIGSSAGYLDGLVALSASDVWAVGETDDGTRVRTLVEHWNGTAWSIVTSPNAAGDNQLKDVTAVSPNDLWAVGASSSGGSVSPLTLHYTGGAWTTVAAPKAGGDNTSLEGISAVSANNVWAVGAADNGSRTTTVAEHWNGSSWSVSSTPNPGSQYDALLEVVAVSAGEVFAVGTTFKARALSPMILGWDGSSWSPTILSVGAENWLRSASAVSPTDIWAVGSARAGNGWRPLAEHYDGSAWNVVPTATTGDPYVVLTGVAAVDTDDVWAVGQLFDGSLYHPLAEHYNGSAWSIVATPDLGGPEGYLQSVAVVSPNNVWAVGETYDGTHFHPLIEHWNGSAWSVNGSLDAIPGDAQLASVTALSSTDVWAVGSKGSPSPGTLAVHWDGASWTQAVAPDAGDTSVLTSVSGTGGGNVWAVGYQSTGADTATLTERWDGSAWSIVPSPNAPEGNIMSILLSVDARQPNDVWAAGFYNTGAVTKTLVLHFDGTAWALDPTPNFNDDDSNDLDAIVAPAAGQVWAVGTQEQLGMQETLCPVMVTNGGFAPTPLTIEQGGLVTWAVPESAGQNHTVDDATKMGLFASGTLTPGSSFSFAFPWAGVFKEKDATTGKKGTVKVRLAASPTSGLTTDLYTLTYATQAPPAGFVEDIQLKRPGAGGYVDWRTGLTGTSVNFTPDAGAGSYLFRASLRRTSNAAHSGWAKVTIVAH